MNIVDTLTQYAVQAAVALSIFILGNFAAYVAERYAQ